MNDEEVDIVAAELAKLGGTSWYPGREKGPILRVVTERYRDRARAAIAALDRYRSNQANAVTPQAPAETPDNDKQTGTTIGNMRVGATVVYRPPGERRTYPCTIERISDDFVYLVPQMKNHIGWVPASEIWNDANFRNDLQAEERTLGAER